MKFDELLDDDDPRPSWIGPDDDIYVGYGACAYELTEEDIERLKRGDILDLDVSGEYGVYVRLERAAVEALARRRQALAELVAQAQELDMGYGPSPARTLERYSDDDSAATKGDVL